MFEQIQFIDFMPLTGAASQESSFINILKDFPSTTILSLINDRPPHTVLNWIRFPS